MSQSQWIVLIAGLFGLQMGVVCLALLRTPGMGGIGLKPWAAAGLAVCAAAVALVSRQWLPGGSPQGLAELMLVLALSAMLYGTRRFFGKRGHGWIWVALNAVILAAVGWMTLSRAPEYVVLLGLAAAGAVYALGLALIVLARVAGRRGIGRLAALSLLLIALASTLVSLLQAYAAAQDGRLFLPVEAGSLGVLHVFAAAGLSISFALMAYDRLRRLLEQRARHDDLTQVLTRGAFWEDFEAACEQAERKGQPLTVAFVDLDHFKAINDLYGHLAGDGVLRHFAGLLSRSVRAEDVVGRLDGEEFGIVMPNTSLDRGRAATLKLSTLVRGTPCPSEPDAIHYTVSVGMAERRPGEGPDALMRRADSALYEAKTMGRNCVASDAGRPQDSLPRFVRARDKAPH
ncbi:GGDEF domain-containing protein [Cupriavidus sp. USMAA2-4]|uniref:diguanylate cyclase n=2 Tax=Cupriavidus malaysiensis TaxID=367825 RepID=A0ABM6F644_9BURK|nr:GGDEF domain-containing protein [Cupriavidus sp. USMAA2-4]AOY93474.1 GGDEF domain-containing protein [Cupriavidus sp. USMAA2-4]AOZ06993.1 GGDEF domain-containing protein [Cupriavidus malaysiensis]